MKVGSGMRRTGFGYSRGTLLYAWWGCGHVRAKVDGRRNVGDNVLFLFTVRDDG